MVCFWGEFGGNRYKLGGVFASVYKIRKTKNAYISAFIAFYEPIKITYCLIRNQQVAGSSPASSSRVCMSVIYT